MRTSAVWPLLFCTAVDVSTSCFLCFVDLNDIVTLCLAYYTQNHRDCALLAEEIINNNQKVIEAGRVAEGYERQLKDILYAPIAPHLSDYDGTLKDDEYYTNLFQSIADNFTAEASKLPRGLQPYGRGYNCIDCQYDDCGYPIDCPSRPLPRQAPS
ncbi:sperm acrosome membrane-associated protein 6 isoform X1 [Arapaima gigas]